MHCIDINHNHLQDCTLVHLDLILQRLFNFNGSMVIGKAMTPVPVGATWSFLSM